VRRNGQATHWRPWPAINITDRPDIQLRGANQLLLNDQLILYNMRQTFRFTLTRPIYDVDLSVLADSLGVMYAEQLRSAGNLGEFCSVVTCRAYIWICYFAL